MEGKEEQAGNCLNRRFPKMSMFGNYIQRSRQAAEPAACLLRRTMSEICIYSSSSRSPSSALATRSVRSQSLSGLATSRLLVYARLRGRMVCP